VKRLEKEFSGRGFVALSQSVTFVLRKRMEVDRFTHFRERRTPKGTRRPLDLGCRRGLRFPPRTIGHRTSQAPT
jgi:hypothetical protein